VLCCALQPVHITLERLEACLGWTLSKAAAELGMTRQDIIRSCKCVPKNRCVHVCCLRLSLQWSCCGVPVCSCQTL
jgi:hypothetical protein